ncbi:helix-turn-helix transcriptional regulator [Nesterenkonia sp. E16_7]|nr:helix-turn-helix transcriptional regulator [Nesterenkonia sp. E16_10]MBO0597402.1 helix-turn-helix transcriptional regulator [Nesterenkonia sp. E16_7]
MPDRHRTPQTVPESSRRLAGLLRATLAEQNVHHYQFARSQQISTRTAHRWLAGKHDFTLAEIQRISEYLELSPQALYAPPEGAPA